jgi:hypothetical protein
MGGTDESDFFAAEIFFKCPPKSAKIVPAPRPPPGSGEAHRVAARLTSRSSVFCAFIRLLALAAARLLCLFLGARR